MLKRHLEGYRNRRIFFNQLDCGKLKKKEQSRIPIKKNLVFFSFLFAFEKSKPSSMGTSKTNCIDFRFSYQPKQLTQEEY